MKGQPHLPERSPSVPARTWGYATTAIGFRPDFLDVRRGIRIGNLEPHERLTRILKAALETRYAEEFVTERWGRGVFWQWIGFLSRRNRAAKPLSGNVSFGCSKFFVMIDTDDHRFRCGFQVERGYLRAPSSFRACRLRSDWDWHRLRAGLTPRGRLYRELRRLASEGFEVHAGSWADPGVFDSKSFPGAGSLLKLIDLAPARHWAGFQVCYVLDEAGIKACSGVELVETMLAVFDEVAPAMNLCMQVPLRLDCPGIEGGNG
jgi:hypothetical protein